ncbi:MAG: hypothetical protein RLZZ352_1574 [Pseudomonadota bacterium]|jgi:hypothetical protein
MNSRSDKTRTGAPSPAEQAPRYASSDTPVNRRTARQPLVSTPPPQAHASLRQRVAQVRVRQHLGRSWQQRLAVPGHRAQGSNRLSLALPMAVVGVLGLFLAWLEASWPLALGALAVVLLAVAGGWWMRRPLDRTRIEPLLPLFDATALERLDTALQSLTDDLRPEHWNALRRLADTLERIAPLMQRLGVNEHFTQEDHFYVTECVRRYLPDTLQAYLQVPRQHRDQALAAASPTPTSISAHNLLNAQLTLLQAELDRREQALNRASAQALQQQQRFLEAKRSRNRPEA